jgi:hypothetical protein
VEIVGRDGVVRRYTFEDSIRLYQRRITFAPIRYRDDDLVRAEVNHCRSRIGQLRRSYFHRYGWGTPDGQPSAEQCFGDLCGELAAFMSRVLDTDERPEIRFDQLQQESHGASTWFVTPEDARAGMLLYVHRFAEGNDDASREAFFASLKCLERHGRTGGDTERLIAFHHTVDCGFVLTGRGGDVHQVVRSGGRARAVDLAPTPWDEVLEIIRKGDYEAALQRCKGLVGDQPYHRNAYVAGAMLANFLGEHHVAESLASVGVRYFPRDGALHYYLGVALLRIEQGEPMVHLQQAVELAPDMMSARALLGLLHAEAGRSAEACEVLTVGDDVQPDDRRAAVELEQLRQWIRWRRHMNAGGIALLLISLVATALVGVPGLVPGIVGAVVVAGGWVAFYRQLDAVSSRLRFEEISQGLRRLHRVEASGPPVS